MEKGCFILKDRKGNVDRFPLFENEIKEVVLKSGNMVSTGIWPLWDSGMSMFWYDSKG